MHGLHPPTVIAAAQDAFGWLHEYRPIDLAIMIPYVLATAILVAYGMHRSWLVYCYLRHRRNVPAMPPPPAEWPTVTIQLPVYNERYVIERLVDAVARFDYPRERLEIQVLDDSTDETREVARACVERYRALGLPIRYLHRSNRTGFKAGALAEGLKSSTGELVVLFDADFLPAQDFLRRTVPYFADSRIGMVQTRWTYLNCGYSALTRVETIVLDAYMGMEHLARSRSGVFFNFTGTAGLWRRAAIEDAGGWEHDTLTEDIDLSYRAQLRGWRFLYLPEIECLSELPVDMNAFKEQQARWAKGSMQVGKKILPRLLRSKERLRIKTEAFLHLTGGVTCIFMVVLAVLAVPFFIVRLSQDRFQSLLIDVPCVASTCSIVAYFLAAQRVLYPLTWKRSIPYMPLMFAVGFGLSLRVSKAVLEALLGLKSDFIRTPKFNIHGRFGSWHRKKYRNRAGWMPYLEIGFGVYLTFALIYAIHSRTYRIVPLLLLLVWGLMYVGLMSLMQRWWEGLRTDVRGMSASTTSMDSDSLSHVREQTDGALHASLENVSPSGNQPRYGEIGSG